MTVNPGTPPPTAASISPRAVEAGRKAGSGSSSIIMAGMLSLGGGVAASRGWHVSLPFLPTFLGYLVALLGTSHFSHVAASTWHAEKGRTAAQIATQVKTAEVIAEDAAKIYLAHQKVAS